MASDLDDQWLYGNSTEEDSSPVTAKEHPTAIIRENGNGTAIERPQTPTLDDLEVTLDAPSLPAVSKIVSTAPDLQPKQPVDDPLIPEDATGKDEEELEEDTEKREEPEEGAESESDEDDVQITIGEIANIPGGYNRSSSYMRMAIGSGAAGAIPAAGKKVDLDATPQIAGQNLLDFDLETAAEKPWRLPGTDITDYFNYGFTEETWKMYCEKQRKMRGEVAQFNKIAVHSARPSSVLDTKSIPPIGIPLLPPSPAMIPPGFHPSMVPHLHPPFMHPPQQQQQQPIPTDSFQQLDEDKKSREKEGSKTPEQNESTPAGDNASDGRATPGLDVPVSSTKLPLLPPPSIPATSVPSMPPRMLPPPFGLPPPGFPGMPPGQENIAAAMAAMFGGGIRPPDPIPNMPPPHLLPNMPPFPPHGFPGSEPTMLPPPFPGMPPPFPIGDHGPILDDRGIPIPPADMLAAPGRLIGQGFPWDPSMGPPPADLLEALAHRDEHRTSRSRSRSSSFSRSHSRSRSSSYDDRNRSTRKRERRHRRHSRSRSRDRERDRHRSSRHHRNGDHHRSDRHERERDRERERDKERDRESRKRREHRDEKSRHERSSRRHRSSSRNRDEERSSRKEKSSKTDQEQVRESRSKSRTPT